MAAYHKKFKHLKIDAIRTARDLVKARPWSKEQDEQLRLANSTVQNLSVIYGLSAVPAVVFGAPDHNGAYVEETNQILLGFPFSVVTLLHEFRHAMVVLKPDVAMVGDSEEDARGWSLSLFKRAAPRRFRKMVNAGRIMFVTPDDLDEPEDDGDPGTSTAADPDPLAEDYPGQHVNGSEDVAMEPAVRPMKWDPEILLALEAIARPATPAELVDRILGAGPHASKMTLSNAIGAAARRGLISRSVRKPYRYSVAVLSPVRELEADEMPETAENTDDQ